MSASLRLARIARLVQALPGNPKIGERGRRSVLCQDTARMSILPRNLAALLPLVYHLAPHLGLEPVAAAPACAPRAAAAG